MSDAHTVVAVNYHRIGSSDPDNPLHRLHTVTLDEFAGQLAAMRQLGRVVSLPDVRDCRNLTEVNFVVTFDDVPISARVGIELMLDQQLPVTISPCAQLATHGWGIRDKVYSIDKFADPALVAATIRDVLPTARDTSFYHLTKSDEFDPELIETKLIDPLYTAIETQAAGYLAGGGYLSWGSLAELAASPLVTIANHTATHANLAAAPHERLEREITVAHRATTERLGCIPRYLTIPFGRMQQNLALDCSTIGRRMGYHGLLWVGDIATLIRFPYQHQLLHLTRLHAPTTADDFRAALEQLLRRRYEAAVWQMPRRRHGDAVSIRHSSDPDTCLDFENLVRQGKDYTCSPAFYRHMFTINPAKGDRPDVTAVVRDGRVEATAYQFHTRFRLGMTTVPGVYLASWRSLPEAHRSAAGRLVQAMTAREAIVGVSWPSPTAVSAFRGWRQVAVWRLKLPATAHPTTARLLRIVAFDRYPDAVTPLADALMQAQAFTVLRDPAFYRWRHETYPLATCRYILLYDGADAVAFAITLRAGNRLQIADWYGPATDTYLQLTAAAHDLALNGGATSVEFITSDKTLLTEITARYPQAAATGSSNYYHLNAARLAEHGIADPGHLWPSGGNVHETASTGDVLIR